VIARWGTLRFDSDRRLVVNDGGECVHLTPKAFDLLQILIEEAPRVVRKGELHARLWPESFVSDLTLAGLVKDLRRALGSGHAADSESFIRTSHGIGYAFDGPLHRITDWPCDVCWVVVGDRRIRLKSGENIVGRAKSSDVCLEPPGVSRRHARIVIGASGAFLEDLGSKNGTAVSQGHVTVSVPLLDGEVILVGPVSLTYRSRPSDLSSDTTVVTSIDPDWHGYLKAVDTGRPLKIE
jgi:DNA-binding winged helix-turn-helix (wHTH) protein